MNTIESEWLDFKKRVISKNAPEIQKSDRIDAGIYTLCELSRLSGITTRSLNLYIQKGWLKAEKRNDVTQIEYIIKAADLRKFIIEYVANIDILRFDKFWLVDVLTQTIK